MKIEISRDLADSITTALTKAVEDYSDEAARSNTDSLYEYWNNRRKAMQAALFEWNETEGVE